MDFNDTPEEALYREQVRAWLAENAPTEHRTLRAIGDLHDLEHAKAWQKLKAQAGYAQIAWPKEWGGGGGTTIQSIIFNQEEIKAGVMLSTPFAIGLGMCIPTIMAVAGEETKRRFVGPAIRGDEIWCQLFSEPSSGSDLASVRTRAVRDGDGWFISGQKIWTSGAHYSDFGLLLARTNPDAVKHKGLTMFWVDMKAPGITIRPIHEMSGSYDFNEVFFADLHMSDKQRLGAVDDGWRVSLVTLMNERASIGGGNVGSGLSVDAVLRLAANLKDYDGRTALDNQSLRETLADWYVQAEGLRLTGMRSLTALSRGEIPGPESSITKVVMANLVQDISRRALELQDQFGLILDPAIALSKATFQLGIFGAPALRIAGGTDEILRNIIAERVLGLPGRCVWTKMSPSRNSQRECNYGEPANLKRGSRRILATSDSD